MSTSDLESKAGSESYPWPEGALAALRNGLRALAREEVGAALEHLQAAVAQAPDLPEAHAYLSSALIARGEVAGAQGAVETALRLAPDGFAPNLKAGELSLRLGDPDRAATHFLVALRAAEPGTRDAAAAKVLLAESRRRVRDSIPHHAVLPAWRLRRWRRGDRLDPVEGQLLTMQRRGGPSA